MTRHRGGNGFWVVQELSYGRRIFALSSRTGEVIAFKRSGWAISIDFKYSKESRSLGSSTHMSPPNISRIQIFPTKIQNMAYCFGWVFHCHWSSAPILVLFFLYPVLQEVTAALCAKKKGPLDFYYSHSSSAIHYLLVAMWWLLLSQLNSLVYIYCSLHTSQMLMFWACWCDLFLQYINSP